MKLARARSSRAPSAQYTAKRAPGQFGGALQVEDSQLLAEFPVRLGLEIEMRRRAPAAGFDVIGFALPYRHAGVRNIRDCRQNFAQARFLFGGLLFGVLNLLAQFFGLLDLRRGVLAALLEFGNLLGSAVALRLQSFGSGDRLAALAIDGAKVFQNFRRIHSALAQLFFDQRQVVTHKIQIEHCALTLAERGGSVHAGGQSL